MPDPLSTLLAHRTGSPRAATFRRAAALLRESSAEFGGSLELDAAAVDLERTADHLDPRPSTLSLLQEALVQLVALGVTDAEVEGIEARDWRVEVYVTSAAMTRLGGGEESYPGSTFIDRDVGDRLLLRASSVPLVPVAPAAAAEVF